jgi:hypothetical protein
MSLGVTYADVRRELGLEAGWGRDPSDWSAEDAADGAAILKDGLLSFYTALDPSTGRAHRWSFLFPTSTLTTTAPYSTGTIGIVNGVVTLTGGVWPAAAADGELNVSGRAYTVNTRDSNTQLTLDDLTVNVTAGATYCLGFPFITLPADFGRLDGRMSYRPGDVAYDRPLELRSEPQLHLMRQKGEITAPPRYVALRPKRQTAGQQQLSELFFHPTPDAAYQVWYRYAINPDTLDGTNTTPPGGVAHGQTIIAAVLAAFERRFSRDSAHWRTVYAERLRQSIAVDKDLSTPDYLGGMRGGTDQAAEEYPPRALNYVTYNGVVPW